MNNTDANDRITMALPSNLIAQIDAQVGGEFTDREDFVRTAVRRYLDYLQEKSNTNASGL